MNDKSDFIKKLTGRSLDHNLFYLNKLIGERIETDHSLTMNGFLVFPPIPEAVDVVTANASLVFTSYIDIIETTQRKYGNAVLPEASLKLEKTLTRIVVDCVKGERYRDYFKTEDEKKTGNLIIYVKTVLHGRATPLVSIDIAAVNEPDATVFLTRHVVLETELFK